MSKQNPECPVVIPKNCPDFRNGRVCALVRSDKKCFHKRGPRRNRIEVNCLGSVHQPNAPRPIRNVQTERKKGVTKLGFYREPM